MKCADFYASRIPDHNGRYLSDLREYGFDQLELRHDFIQWLFPLPEPSPVNPVAPVIQLDDIEAFQQRPELRAALDKSFRIMLAFYGFEITSEEPIRIGRGAVFLERARNWLTQGNHNHLRITRILRCLRLLGLEPQARAFFAALEKIYEESRSLHPPITLVTWRFWQAAMTGTAH